MIRVSNLDAGLKDRPRRLAVCMCEPETFRRTSVRARNHARFGLLEKRKKFAKSVPGRASRQGKCKLGTLNFRVLQMCIVYMGTYICVCVYVCWLATGAL